MSANTLRLETVEVESSRLVAASTGYEVAYWGLIHSSRQIKMVSDDRRQNPKGKTVF